MKDGFILSENQKAVSILVEETAYEGVKRIAQKVADDIKMVCQVRPEIVAAISEAKSTTYQNNIIIFATIGKSSILEELGIKKEIHKDQVEGKREVYEIIMVQNPWEGIEQALVIYGSDKRGTIYGMFHLSEQVGVSPMVYWGDAVPAIKEELILSKEIEVISKEPSVKYRGFFINDEWPCFGNWTFEHFGGFTAEMYDHVFELLLRLKGNYLWPAMWTSSFPLDGPGLKSAELADLYGVIIGNSHHEPCLRASEEWDLNRGEDTEYGNEWNYNTNKEGLLRYWEDGLKRSAKFESIITIGMRGERDSSMLEPDATLKQNIDLLKDIITEQKKLIQKHVNKNLEQVPMLLALYKEVEAYFYGDEQVQGLKDWDELDGVTLMLCEDNHGNMRTLPTEEMRNHKGGFGMYYHFDYHGDPISYEWVNSTPLTKTWEQMTMAYEYGVRDIWIVNVGDLKFNEFPLSYFMNLAYDFEKWGTSAPNRTDVFTIQWIRQQFGSFVSEEVLQQLSDLQTSYVRVNGMRRPEALNEHIYHAVHYREADRMLKESERLIALADTLYKTMPPESRDAYYSMIYFPAAASMNLLQMHLYAAKNEHYAKQGKKAANQYAEKVTECIEKDRQLAKQFGEALNGKWNGMQLAPHIGFTKWNEDNYRYPIRMQVEPAYKPRMIVSRADEEKIAVKDYFAPMIIEVKDFLYEPNTEVDIEVANDGIGTFIYNIHMEECDWLTVQTDTTTVEVQKLLHLHCNREKLPKKEEKIIITLDDKDTKVEIHVYGKAVDTTQLPPMTFLENNGVIAIESAHYAKLKQTEESKLILLEDFGRSGYGLKAMPVTKRFETQKAPSAIYLVSIEEDGEYVLEVVMAPSNPMEHGTAMRYGVKINNEAIKVIDSIPEGFLAGVPHNEGWTKGALNQVRTSKNKIQLDQGLNSIEISMIDPGFVLERLIIYSENCPPKHSYLGPTESYYKN